MATAGDSVTHAGDLLCYDPRASAWLGESHGYWRALSKGPWPLSTMD
jgi:hypothetical protein